MATPHNQANKGDIAKTVLMPGDPLRIECHCVNHISLLLYFDRVCFDELIISSYSFKINH